MSNNSIKLYIAGKVSKESFFGTHYWRDDFCKILEELSGYTFDLLDPTKVDIDQFSPEAVFKADCRMISEADLFIVYLSDDISVGGSQEILIAKYFKKPVIGLAPYGGKFNGGRKELFGKTIEDYKDPFVFSTCDYVCGTVDEVAATIKQALTTVPKTFTIFDEAINTTS